MPEHRTSDPTPSSPAATSSAAAAWASACSAWPACWPTRPARPRAAGADLNPLAPKAPHFPAKAKQVVHLFMNGGPSHVDTFDPKPLLDKYHGKPLPEPEPPDRAQDRRGDAVAVQVPEVRPERHRGQRAVRQDGRASPTTSA